MSPEYGATCGFFPVDEEALLHAAHRPGAQQVELVKVLPRAGPLPRSRPRARYSQVIELDLGDVEPSLAGPRRPLRPIPLTEAKSSFLESLSSFGVPYRNGSPDKEIADTFPASDPASTGAPGHESPRETEEEKHPEPVAVVLAEPEQSAVPVSMGGETFDLEHGSVVIAAITSCTNTSNPSVMVAAGLLAQNAVERGLARKPWVKSSLAPGSKVVTEYYDKAGLTPFLEALGFHTVGYGRRASGTRGRFRPRSRRPSSRATSSSAPSSPGTATSRRASTRR